MYIQRGDSGVYVFFLIGIVTLWPLFLLISSWPLALKLVLVILLIILSSLLLFLVWKYTSSNYVSFMKGVNIISANLETGCLNVTILYLIPYLIFVYFLFVYHTFKGFSRGRAYTQQKWYDFVKKRYDDYIATKNEEDNTKHINKEWHPPNPKKNTTVKFYLTITSSEATKGTTKVITRNNRRLEVTIPAGVKTGTKVRLNGALQITDGYYGDLEIVIRVI
jgi:hypothetical protein